MVIVSDSLSPLNTPSTTSVDPPALASDTTPSSVITPTPLPTLSSTPRPLPSLIHLATSPSSVVVPPPTVATIRSAPPPALVEPAETAGLVGTLHRRDVSPPKQREMEGEAEVGVEEDEEVPPPDTEERGTFLEGPSRPGRDLVGE